MMMSCFERLRKSGLVATLGLSLLMSAASLSFAQSGTAEAVPVLEGLDPIMLVQGKEVQGNLKITVTRGKFQYLFANAENKATFEKDPARYEIQLDGSCARMGPPVTGNPDLYTVYQSKIYIFGSSDCKTTFEAAPAKFLATEGGATTKVTLTPEGLKKGQALIEKAVAAAGGAAQIDSLSSYQEKSTFIQGRHAADVEVKSDLTVLFPDRLRLEQVMPDFGNAAVTRQMAFVVTPRESFLLMQNKARPMPEAARMDLQREMQRRPLWILRSRKSSNFNPMATGTATVGEAAVEQVVVDIDGTNYTLGMDPVTGRLITLSYWRRGPVGYFGKLTKVFSDFRTVEGVTLPFKVTATFNDEPWKEQSANVVSVTINGKMGPAMFEKPVVEKPKPGSNQ
jgi:YHS domain-containing protein